MINDYKKGLKMIDIRNFNKGLKIANFSLKIGTKKEVKVKFP